MSKKQGLAIPSSTQPNSMTPREPQEGAARARCPGRGAHCRGQRWEGARAAPGADTARLAAPPARAAPRSRGRSGWKRSPGGTRSRRAPVPPAATDLARRRRTGRCRPAGPCSGTALGRGGRGARGGPCVPPGSAGHMAWCGRGAASGAPTGAAAWPGGSRRRRTQAPLRTRAARGRPGVWFLPAEEGGLWGGSSSREPPPRSRRG